MNVNWYDVSKVMPQQKRIVMLTGDSGMVGDKARFLTLGFYDNEYRPPRNGKTRWLDVINTDLSDYGFEVTHWAEPIALPSPYSSPAPGYNIIEGRTNEFRFLFRDGENILQQKWERWQNTSDGVITLEPIWKDVSKVEEVA